MIGDHDIVTKEEQFEQHALQKYEKLKNEENKRRLEKIALEKKKMNAEFEAELNEKYKDYDDMVRKRNERQAELDAEALGIQERIEQNKALIKKKAGQFEGIDRNEIMMDLQRNADAIDSIITLEHREQFFKMKQKMELRKKQVRRAKEAREEAEKQTAANVVGGKFGKFLSRRAGTIDIEDIEDDNSVLLQRLKAWKQRKSQYMRQMAENMTVDMEKDQVQMMIVKLMTIESQLKELNSERNRAGNMMTLNSKDGSRRGSHYETGTNRATSAHATSALGLSRQGSYSSLNRVVGKKGTSRAGDYETQSMRSRK